MILGSLLNRQKIFDIRPGEARRVLLMAVFLFFLLAANNVIKVVRDSLFLSRFPITQLPYVYLLAALVAAAVIGLYARFAPTLTFGQVIRASLALMMANVLIFWLLVTFYGASWVIYAYYIWSAIVGLVLVAQFWTLANGMFTPRDGKRLFGLITAGGTVGGMAGGIVARSAVSYLFGTTQLLLLVGALFAAAYSVASLALAETATPAATRDRQPPGTGKSIGQDQGGVIKTLLASRYLQTIAAVIFVSVIVSTLIDYQFKAAAKESYQSADALAGFFGSYYAWLSGATLAAQLWLTGKVLTGLGLTPGLSVLPFTLVVGSIGFLAWPGLFTATANRMTEASLRTSINQSAVQILYLPIPDSIKKKVKVFMDVTVERLGDAVAAIVILAVSFALEGSGTTPLSFFTIGLLLIWIAVVLSAQGGYVDTLRRSLAYREVSLEGAPIDFTDKATVEIVVGALDKLDEPSVLFGLDLAEKLDPQMVAARLPRSLFTHGSSEVRRRALMLMASSLDANVLAMLFELLTSENEQVRVEASNTIATVLKKASIPVILPFLKSNEAQTRRAAIRLMLQSGDPGTRQDAFSDFRALVTDYGPAGEQNRVEAARLMGELHEPEFYIYLKRLIKEDPSAEVTREAMAAAAKGGYRALVPDIISRLGDKTTKIAAHEALLGYGESAVRGLRGALFDTRTPREIRLSIPRALSKIHAQSAMNALLAGLLEEERVIRFKVILALEEMARHFTDLKIDRDIVESAVTSDALLYCRRLVIFSALFSQTSSSDHEKSLLYLALAESMERVIERIMWLLSLIYLPMDIRRAWSGLNSADPLQRAHAVELLDNLLTGDVKTYVFPLYSDSQPDRRLRRALDYIGIDSLDADGALRALLTQDDRWLKVATVWEIGLRKLPGFGDVISTLTGSDDKVLDETAKIVMREIL